MPSPCSDLRCPNQAARLVPLAFFDRRACSGSLYPPQAAVAFAASPQLRIPNKNPHGGVRHGDLCLVRKMGLEPTRHRHTHLKRACLPIPALPQIAFDCKKDSSTFGGIKSSPISYLFSCPIKQPLIQLQPLIPLVIQKDSLIVRGAVFARSNYRQRQISREHMECSPTA